MASESVHRSAADSDGVGTAPHADSLRCEGVWSGYADLTVLRGVSASVKAGTIEAILGRNGAGKTTMAATIVGLLRAKQGRIWFSGRDVTDLRPDERVRIGLGLVQEGRRVFRSRTVSENLAIGGRRLARRARMEEQDRVLDLFPSLQDLRGRRAGELSGGQQQMLAIGLALMGRPRVLILDEPSAGLSPIVVDQLVDAIAGLRDAGLTIVLIEQLVDVALALADHVTIIKDGTVVLSDLPAAVGDAEVLSAAYF